MYAATGEQNMKWGLAGTTWPPRWRRSCKGGTLSLKKRGPRRQSGYLSLVSILELAICLIGKAHVTEMKLNLNFFPLGLQIPQISYCIFEKTVICTNLITCSAKLSLHAARPVTREIRKFFAPRKNVLDII